MRFLLREDHGSRFTASPYHKSTEIDAAWKMIGGEGYVVSSRGELPVDERCDLSAEYIVYP